MKVNSSELFDLIKSLNAGEKKRIRNTLFRSEVDKKTLRLYDIINNQKKFDDNFVRKKLGNPKWFPQLKKYLIECLIDEIYSHNPDKEKYTYVLKLIIVAERFLEKNLVSHAEKKLQQAATIAKKNNWIEFIPIINTRLSNIIGDRLEQKKNYTFYAEAYNSLNQSYLEKKYSLLFRCIEFAHDTNSAQQFATTFSINECLADENKFTTLLQKLHYYQFLASYYKIIAYDYDKSYFYCKKYLEIVLEKNKEEEKNISADNEEWQMRRVKNNMVGLINVIIAAVNASKLKELDDLFASFVELEKKNKYRLTEEIKKLFKESELVLYFLISCAKITREGVESINFNSYIERLHRSEKNINTYILTSCNELIALYFFMKTEWSNCAVFINKIVNDTESYKVYPELYARTLLIQLFLNFETNDLDVMEFNLKKTERYFEKRYKATEYEKLILLFFNELIVSDRKAVIPVMKKYRQKLEHLLTANMELSKIHLVEKLFIDFGCWIDSKIYHTSLQKIVRENCMHPKFASKL